MTTLTPDEQHKLHRQMVDLRLQNEIYLRQHPELHAMLEAMVKRIVLEKPPNVREFCIDFFCRTGLADYVNETNRKY